MLKKLWFKVKNWFVRKFTLKRIVVYLLLILAVSLSFKPLIKGIGNFLISEDELSECDAIFTLGGNIYDRSIESARLYKEGWAPKILPIGGNVANVLKAMNMEVCDAFIAETFLKDLGVPPSHIIPIPKGTSTKEEADAILEKCKENGWGKIIIVSDKFHTRRVRWVFDSWFEERGITVVIRGASHSEYREDAWWNYEQGLLMVNNEYVKLFYYMLKY